MATEREVVHITIVAEPQQAHLEITLRPRTKADVVASPTGMCRLRSMLAAHSKVHQNTTMEIEVMSNFRAATIGSHVREPHKRLLS